MHQVPHPEELLDDFRDEVHTLLALAAPDTHRSKR